MTEHATTDDGIEEVRRRENEAWLESRELYDPDDDPEVIEERRQDPTMNEDAADLDLSEYERQWEAFDARWRAHTGVAEGPLEVRQAVLRTEPPRVVLGRKGLSDPGDEVTVSLGRDDGPAVQQHDHTGQRLSVRQAADKLAINGPTMGAARAAVLDGLEQSEAAAGRTPADRAPVSGQVASVRERNAERMARQVPAGIRNEDPAAALHSDGPRLSR